MQNRRSTSPGRPKSLAKSKRSHDSGKSSEKREWDGSGSPPEDGVPAFKRDFEKFHGENGVRTVIGSIGPANNGMSVAIFMIPADVGMMHVSSYATQVRLSARLHVAQVCAKTQIYTT